MMKQKVVITMDAKGHCQLQSHVGCGELNPKELMLYSGALCAAMTLNFALQKIRQPILGLELEVVGMLSTETLRAESLFFDFEFNYRLECPEGCDQEAIARTVRLAHDSMCGLVQMFRKIGPVMRNISMVVR